MIPNLDRIREVASKDSFSDEIMVFLDNLATQDRNKALYVTKTLFFAPETHPRVRHALSSRMGKWGQKQLFQQLLSYFILHKFPDTLSLISALASFSDPEALPALAEYYPNGTFKECLAIIGAISGTSATETVELLSSIYNEQINYTHVFSPQEKHQIRQQASSALGKNMMRFDFGV